MTRKIPFIISIGFNVLIITVVTALVLNWKVIVGYYYLEPQYKSRTSLFDAFTVTPSSVVFIGDSITEQGPWQDMFPNSQTKNRGIGGDTTTGTLKRLDEIIAGKPQTLFVMIGTNDLTHGPAERSISYQQYADIVMRLRAGMPNADIYLQSLLPRGLDFQEEVLEYNRKIAEVAITHNAKYIDLYTHYVHEDGSIDNQYSADELHLNGKGYVVWQGILDEYVK